jgi:hypothetical protein
MMGREDDCSRESLGDHADRSTGAMTYISRAFWSSLRAKPSGTYVYRGYSAACAASGREKVQPQSRSRRGSNSSQLSVAGERRSIEEKRPVVAAAVKGLGLDKEMLGVKQVLDDVKETVKVKDSDTSALEEENAPLVSAR